MNSVRNSDGSAITVRRLAGRIGAEIESVKLSGSLPGPQVAAIRQALLAHRVVFFRDQAQFDDAAQEGFSRLLGKLVPHPTEKVLEGSLGILELDAAAGNGKADQWHTDVTFVDAYPRYSVLRARARFPSMAATRCGPAPWRDTRTCRRS